MNARMADVQPRYPRFFRIGGYWINSYKFFLCVGIYTGSLATAALADRSGFSPLRFGFGAMGCALAGLAGARVYHVIVHAPVYFRQRSRCALWDSSRSGWSVFGALLTFIPASFGAAALLQIPIASFWDHMGIGVLTGGFWIRLGCVFNGCCAGRESHGFLAVHLHDTHGVRRRRIPVQFLEMAWWALGTALFLAVWPTPLPAGSYALGVLGWYGAGRFFLEPMRERPDVIFGAVRVNQVVAGLLTLIATAVTVTRILASR